MAERKPPDDDTRVPVLSVRNLRVEFGTRRGVLTAIDDVSFDIAKGEVLGVVGESGAGKSLTGAAIAGLIDPPGRVVAGDIRLSGQRIDRLDPQEMRQIRGRRIGMVNHVVADAELDAEAERLCAELAALGGDSLKPTKSFYRFAETARPEANADHAVNLIANAIHAKGNVG